MKLSIRKATGRDALLIADISRQSFYDTFAADNTKEDMKLFLSQQFSRRMLMMEVGKREHTFFLAYADDQIAGYVKLKESPCPAALPAAGALEIARLYSLKAFIGQGVGKLLMETSIGHARELGKEAVWLCVWEKNQRAIDFYTAFGFQKFSDTVFQLGNDVQNDWMMWRKA
jgi:diamine N-acetyltransferase